jgi:hypothetical protein
VAKLDLKKELKEFYIARTERVTEVDVPEGRFLMIDGRGDPNTSPAYPEAMQALYSLAYTVKFTLKNTRDADFAVMPLEGLWWVPDMRDFSAEAKDDWCWTMMIRMPEFVAAEDVEQARHAAAKRKDLAGLATVRLDTYAEGPAAQIMHLGSYSDETENIKKVHAWIADNGYERTGKHHEIYLSDPNRTAVEKLKTIIRQPFKKR